MSDLIYIIAERHKKDLPSIAHAFELRVYTTYEEAEAARQEFPDEFRGNYAVFSFHCVVQQEVTFEAPF